MSIAHQLNRKLDVWRAVSADDGAGGQSTVRALAGTVRARVSQPRAAEQVVADQAGARLDHNIYLLPRADVRRGDHLRPHGQPADSRPYFDVIAVISPSDPLYRRAEVELIQAEED